MQNITISVKVQDTGVEPVNPSEAKLHASVDYTDYDPLIPTYITAARIAIERASGVALVQKNVTETISATKDYAYRLSYSPVQSITSVKCSDGTTAEATSYTNYGAELNNFSFLSNGDYEVKYVAGGNCPADLRLAVLQMFSFIFNHRGEEGVDTSSEAERIIGQNQRFLL